MAVIKDAIHGNIVLSGQEERALDLPQMQRLRRIRQLAMAHLVYPCATHTRFEHSLGTLHITSELCSLLGVGPDATSELRLASLLHDVGHIAFSHESEEITSPTLGTHEELGSSLIRKGPVADAISENFSPKKIASLAFGGGLGALIASDIGSDRMDYLLRDSHYTGVAYGVIDKDRIMHTARLHSRRLAVEQGGLEAAESLLIARFMMFSTVYFHHAVRIATLMVQRSLSDAIKAGEIGKAELVSLGDEEMLSMLCTIPQSAALAQAVRDRKLYKRAYHAMISDIGKIPPKLQETLSAEAGCTVLVDIPYRFWRTPEIPILYNGELLRIDKVSLLVKSLSESQHSRLRLIVACEQKNVPRVAAAAKKLLG